MIEVTVTLACDRCPAHTDLDVPTIRAARRHAARDGWVQHKYLGRWIDLCPTCEDGYEGQERPRCPACGLWRRADHRCRPQATPRPERGSTRRLPKVVHA